MVAGFNEVKTPEDIAYYSGLLLASFAITQTLTIMHWGRLSDRIGRKPVLLIGLIGNAIATLMFGMSRSFKMALFARALGGAFFGNSVVVKSVVVEISDSTNRPRMMALLPLMWNLGSVLGASIGGLFADPVKQYPGWFGGNRLFTMFPYLLPCLIGLSVSLFGIIMGTFRFEETLVFENTLPVSTNSSTTQPTTESSPLLQNTPSGSSVNVGVRPEQRTLRQLLTPTILRVIVNNSLMCLSTAMARQLYPIFAATQPSQGGLGFDTRQIGYSLAISGFVVVYMQLVVYPKLANKYGALFCYQWGMKLLMIYFACIPFLSLLARHIEASFINMTLTASPLLNIPSLPTPWGPMSVEYILLWVILATLVFVDTVGDVLVFTSINLITANVAPSKADLGVMNGVQQLTMSFVRIIGPVLSGYAWSWSLKHSFPFPFNTHFAWIICTVLMAVAAYMSHALPRSVNTFAAERTT
ncbi:hypothetical protein GGI07_002710 [Coemansia sp. Benny D115]|nr:hypothetical protein GGI07_002710 [Coemansia sp. Benny D115]